MIVGTAVGGKGEQEFLQARSGYVPGEEKTLAHSGAGGVDAWGKPTQVKLTLPGMKDGGIRSARVSLAR